MCVCVCVCVHSLEAYGAQVTRLKATTLGKALFVGEPLKGATNLVISSTGDCPSADELRTALDGQNFKLVTFTHVDTSTGVLTDVKTFARIVRELSPQTLIAVDGVRHTSR